MSCEHRLLLRERFAELRYEPASVVEVCFARDRPALHVADVLPEPAGWFDGAELQECRKLCRKAGSQCREYVKMASACYAKNTSQREVYGKKNCDLFETDPQARRECKQVVHDEAVEFKGDLKEVRDANVAECDAWAGYCEDSCGQM